MSEKRHTQTYVHNTRQNQQGVKNLHVIIHKDTDFIEILHSLSYSLMGPPEKHSFITYGLFPAIKNNKNYYN